MVIHKNTSLNSLPLFVHAHGWITYKEVPKLNDSPTQTLIELLTFSSEDWENICIMIPQLEQVVLNVPEEIVSAKSAFETKLVHDFAFSSSSKTFKYLHCLRSNSAFPSNTKL